MWARAEKKDNFLPTDLFGSLFWQPGSDERDDDDDIQDDAVSDSEEADGGKEDDAESNAGDASQADEWDCRTCDEPAALTPSQLASLTSVFIADPLLSADDKKQVRRSVELFSSKLLTSCSVADSMAS